jgi:small subunit ribosomal protein S21
LIKITVKDGEPLEKVLKKFKRRVEQAVILQEVKRREVFLKPSIRKKMKSRAASARNKKREKRRI